MKDTAKNNNFIYFILIIFISCVFIIIAEILIVKNIMNAKQKDKYNNLKYTVNDKYYDTSTVDATEISLDEQFIIGDTCNEGCNYKYKNYYFIIKYINNKYSLIIVDGNRFIKEVSLGSYINNTSIFIYKDYITIHNIKMSDSFTNDYLILINKEDKVDEYLSLESNEIEFNEDGIIYYYSDCVEGNTFNAYKIKAIRKPFNNKVKEISKIEKTYQWCIK